MCKLSTFVPLMPTMAGNWKVNCAVATSKVPKVCHVHYRNREAYLSGHIPGAIDIDTLALEAPET
ncbi:MAG: hypothetical protein L3J66_01190 [Bacteroidales bacterium]|nr:hypothetical protein [Bacteroidales bacterium]